jgi:hypothetical protein
MRENKFRIWNIKEKRYIQEFDDLVIDYNGVMYESLIYDGLYEVNQDNYILEPYTGLKDKNGVDIYEGDNVEDEEYKFANGTIIYEGGCYCIKVNNERILILSAFINKIKVIGNIHEEEIMDTITLNNGQIIQGGNMNKAVMISITPKWFQMIKEGTKTLEFRNYGIPKGTKVYLRETKQDNGTGQVVAEFVVGKCLNTVKDLMHQYSLNEIKALGNQGYTNQHYAMTITDLIVYDEEWQSTNIQTMNISEQYQAPEDYNYNSKIANAPTLPIPYTEFVSWNKVTNLNKPNQGKTYVVEKEWNNE